MPAWISNYINYKVWDEITYPFQSPYIAQLKLENDEVISSHTLLCMRLFIHAELNVIERARDIEGCG